MTEFIDATITIPVWLLLVLPFATLVIAGKAGK